MPAEKITGCVRRRRAIVDPAVSSSPRSLRLAWPPAREPVTVVRRTGHADSKRFSKSLN